MLTMIRTKKKNKGERTSGGVGWLQAGGGGARPIFSGGLDAIILSQMKSYLIGDDLRTGKYNQY